MFQRIARSWRIFKNSLNVLANNKKLIIFPILSAIFLVAIVLIVFGGIATFFIMNPEAGTQIAESAQASSQQGQESDLKTILGVIILFISYFVSVFLATFFNVAFYSEIIRGLRGEPVFIGRGFAFAFSKTGSIAMWALLGASVGTALKLLEERLGWLGQLVVRLIGLAWNVVTIFVVPVIICNQESVNPIKNLKESAGIIRRTWGESLIGFLGISSLNILLMLPVILLTFILAIACMMGKLITLAIAVAILGVIAIAAIGTLLGIAQKIYIASLYLYATEGFLNDAYDQEVMSNPFKTKK